MNNTNIVQSAAVNGLILSLATILTSLISVTIGPAGSIVSILIWLVKFGGTIYILYYFMKKRSMEFEVYTYGNSFKYGFLMCLFSTIACTAYMILQYTVLFPNLLSGSFEQIFAMWDQMGVDPSEVLGGRDIEQFVTKAMYLAYPIYFMIWGLILPAILASTTKRNNIYTYED